MRFFPESRERGVRKQVVCFEAEGVTLIDFVIRSGTRYQPKARTDGTLFDVVLEGPAANAIVAEQELAERGPSFASMKRELCAEENVVLPGVRIECGAAGATDFARRKRGGNRGGDLGVAEELAGVDHEAEMVEGV